MSRHNSPSAARRVGLAPVELVFSIPLVLLVMALSVVVGNAACWKIRAAVVARNAIWSNRKPRSGTPADPWPARWPQSATMNHSASRLLPDLFFPAFQNPLVRGPMPNVVVNSQLLDPTQAVRVGQSNIQQTPPMLARLGQYQFDVQQPLIDGTWAYWQTGQWSNTSRRMPDLYPQTPPQFTAEKAAYDQAVQAIASAPFLSDLAVLDRDDELMRDFYPRVAYCYSNCFCTLDPDVVRKNYLYNPNGLLTRIAGLPRRIAGAFLSLYKGQLAALQAMMPPPPGAQAQIAKLQQKIDMLEDYLSSIN